MQDVAGRVSGSEQDHACRVVDAVNRYNQLDGARRVLSNDQSPESQLRAVEVLAGEPGPARTAPPVELASSGRPEVDVAAMRALAKHSPT